MLERPLEDISRQLSNVQKALASLKRVLELLGISRKITSPAHDISTLNSRNKALALQFEHVSFHYEDQANGKLTTSEDDDQFDNVLEDISFQLATGEVLGLLGRTGSGKTTLTRLLFRLYDPQNGRILLAHNDHQVDLLDIRRMPILALRQQIGMVTQNIELFHATVRDNLTFFEETIPDEQIISVIRQLGLSRWYAGLQYGLDTILEASATSLSAGEAQLLAFSRIFLHDPGIVVLDEASSRLDPATEHLIEKAVDTLTQGRTALIIAHRLKTVQRADKIMILENGRVLEFGDRLALALDPNSRFNHLLHSGMDEVLV
jgi:ABC-type multidrug transport system fused ATPase/permease subunit